MSKESGAEQATIEFKKGEQLTVTSFRRRSGAESKMQEYFSALRPLMMEYGIAGRGSLNVVECSGAFLAEIVAFSTFPTSERVKQFEADPRWPPIKAKRPEIWSELRISKYDFSEPMTLSLAKNKIYELRYEWFAGEEPLPLVADESSAIVASFSGGSHEILPSDLESPARIVLIEWSDLAMAKANGPSDNNYTRVDSIYSQL